MPRSRTLLTAGLVLTTFAVALEALSILPVAPLVARDLPDGVNLYGLVFAGFFFGAAAAIVVAGPIVDRRGPAVVLVGGLVLFTLGLVLAGVAPTMEILVASRVVQGAGAGMVNAVSFATVALAFSAEERPRVLAFISLAWLLPSFVGPLFGGLVAEAFGWRWVFLGLAVLMPLPALLVVPQVLALPRGEPGPPVSPRAVLRSVAPAAGQVRVAAGVILLASIAILGAVSFAPLALADIRGQSSLEAGITIAILSVAWTTATFTQGQLRSVPTALIVRGGLASLALGLPLVALTALPEIPLPVTWAGWALAGLGAGFTFQGANLHVMAAAAAGSEGRATASAQFAATLGNGLGTWIGGVVLALGIGSGLALAGALGLIFGGCIAATLVGLAVAVRLTRAAPAATPAPTPGDGH